MRCALLVEQHAVFRQAVAYLLARDLRVELVEEASTLASARALALENLGSIDVVVSELALPDGEATDFLAALR
jgi:DNA-binding NarL/FixJ family response regulator